MTGGMTSVTKTTKEHDPDKPALLKATQVTEVEPSANVYGDNGVAFGVQLWLETPLAADAVHGYAVRVTVGEFPLLGETW